MDESNHSIFVGVEEMNLRSKKMLYDSNLHHQYMGKHFTRNPITAKDNRLKQSEKWELGVLTVVEGSVIDVKWRPCS